MKHWRIVSCLLLAALLLWGCSRPQTEEPSESEHTPQQTVPALQRYSQAKEAVEQAKNRILSFTVTHSRTVGEHTFTRTETGSASFSLLGSPDMTAIVEKNVAWDSYNAAFREIYRDGCGYVQANDALFSVDLTPQDFALRQLPPVLITGSLYRTVTDAPEGDGTLLTFTEASGGEPWLPEGAVVTEASGTATLDSTGALVQTTCRCVYTLDGISHTVEATVRVTTPQALELDAMQQLPSEVQTRIGDIRLPEFLLEAVGCVFSAEGMTGELRETVYSEALSVTRERQYAFSLSGQGEKMDAVISYTGKVSDHRGEVALQTQTDTFQDGVYSSVTGSGEPVTDPAVDAVRVRQSCEDLILSGLMAAKYLDGGTVEETPEQYILTMPGNSAFGADLMAHIESALGADLDSGAQAVETKVAQGRLVVDRKTGLPVAMRLEFQQAHTVNEVVYQLRYQLELTVSLT